MHFKIPKIKRMPSKKMLAKSLLDLGLSIKDTKMTIFDWIEHGEMNGTNEGVMQSLVLFLNEHDFDHAREYMAELWLRGISKEDFIKWTQENKQ